MHIYKFVAFLTSFLLNSSFAEDLLCPCCYNNYFKNYQDGKSFATDGLDVYVVDDFTNDKILNGDNIFDNYYKHFFEKNEEDHFLPKEQYNINTFMRKEEPSNELHFSSHENPWYWHIYKKEEDNDFFNNNLIENIAKKMSTEGGNNFDWDKGVDRARWFNRFRSKVRHNKNVIIIKLKEQNDHLFKETIFTFRKFVNMSYRPCPIIFTGNFEFEDFNKKLEEFNNKYTEEYGKEQNGVIDERGIVDKRQEIKSQQCFYIQQDKDFVKNVKKKLEEAVFHHNFKDEIFNGETLNIAIIGLPRSGKSLCTNIILDKPLGAKVANDVTSVTQDKTTYCHRDVNNIPIQIIDTPGFEPNKENSVDTLIDYLQENIDENDLNKKRIDDIHVIIYFINAKNFPKPKDFGKAWTDSAGTSRGNEFYLNEEIKLFKIFKKKKVPVIFCIAQSGSFENGYKYLKKWFGDLALNNDLSNYQLNDEDWQAEDQWICPKWTRGSLIQLENDPIEGSNKYTGKYGLVKLMNIIEELFNNNAEYKSRLPETFAGGFSLSGILDKLKNQFIKQQGFNDDTIKAPVINDDNTDIIVREVDKKIPKCLSWLHNGYIESNIIQQAAISMAKKGLINAFAKGEESYSFGVQKIYFHF